ncbi:NP_1176A family transcription regulator [Natronomonas pharaonis DSM 2160]|uniref:NP_1176A family transcription regulator n=1 Tax=Natronomonas pharaonis (strain ATCC 35678 / DSM 2160 / CIP 103997 / JCM 8858 / NBRC 14720 / NCIMB 2260 / Gabara) TaxID=348780 RepID=A0A1U7EV10_NATPD|nr:NP_1176A family transcription regulator [Natronomonas pharaonis DSM 2160]
MSATDTKAVESDGWEAVAELPPSAKLVAKVLEYNDRLTQSQLAEETMLPPRTVRYGLNRLEEVDAVDSRFSFTDARKRVYTLAVEDEAKQDGTRGTKRDGTRSGSVLPADD